MTEEDCFYNASDHQPQHALQEQGMTAMATKGTRELKTPLSSMAEAFEELAKRINDNKDNEEGEGLLLGTFCDACALVSVLFSCLGRAFKFAESEYVNKVRDLVEASKRLKTLQNVVDEDVARGTVRAPHSHTRKLRRVRQGLDLVRALFQQFLSTDDYSLKDAATAAYSQVCARYHTWAVRAAVYAGMYTLPSRDELLPRLNETEQSAEKKMRRYIKASLPVIEYVDRLYVSRDISLDW